MTYQASAKSCVRFLHESKPSRLKNETKQQKSAESKLAIAVQKQTCYRVNSCLVARPGDADFVTGDRQAEGCDSHLLIVTGRGWTPARKEAVISLSSTARCFYCQNFNRATKSILQGQIKKILSEPRHTEEGALSY